ncbi:MAG: hypothetical protein V4476_03805 [Pseudomonadota bacterium]
MRLSRSSKTYAALLVLVSILFMQFAVAAYACPGVPVRPEVQPGRFSDATGDHQHMAGCRDRAAAPSPLCHAHCQPDGQSLDRPIHPDVVPFVATQLVASLVHHAVHYRTVALVDNDGSLLRTTAPPATVRNCCFRI